MDKKRSTTCLYGIGFQDLILASFTEGRKFLPSSLMRPWFRQAANMFGYGLQFNQFTKSVLGIYISEERNMSVAENFLRSLVSKNGKHTVYTDGGT